MDSLSPRLQIGLSLFPSIVAADKNLAVKLDSNQYLKLYLVYQDNELLTRRLQQQLSTIPSIRKYPVTVISISQVDLLRKSGDISGALFIAEPAGNNLDALIQLSRKNRLLVFSPYEGDVERGVTAGYQVTNKVLPMVNMQSLKRAGIDLKAFFLRVAVKYE